MRDVGRTWEEFVNHKPEFTNHRNLLLLYNNSEDARFFHEFIGTINHSWLTNQGAHIDLIIINIKLHTLTFIYIIHTGFCCSNHLNKFVSLFTFDRNELFCSLFGAKQQEQAADISVFRWQQFLLECIWKYHFITEINWHLRGGLAT